MTEQIERKTIDDLTPDPNKEIDYRFDKGKFPKSIKK
jgi:hypothetical protein